MRYDSFSGPAYPESYPDLEQFPGESAGYLPFPPSYSDDFLDDDEGFEPNTDYEVSEFVLNRWMVE